MTIIRRSPPMLSMPMLLALALLATIESAEPLRRAGSPPMDSDDWTDFHYHIYAISGRPLEPSQTRAYLERLAEIYADGPEADRGTQVRKQKVAELLASGELESADCRDTAHLNKVARLLDQNSCFKLNIVPFLQSNRRRLFDKCRQQYLAQLHELDNELTAGEEERLKDLMRVDTFPALMGECARAEPERSAFVAELLNYIEAGTRLASDRKAKSVGVKGRAAFARYFDQVAVNVCELYDRVLEPSLKRRQLLDVGLDLFCEAGDQSARLWLAYGWLCRTLTEREPVLKELHDAYFERHCPRGLLNGKSRH